MLFILCLWTGACVDGFSQPEPVEEAYQLENLMTEEYLVANLNPETPRLILNERMEAQLREKLETDPVVQNMYQTLKLNAEQIQSEPLLEREMVGRRLLATSREMLYRMNMLGMVYRIEKERFLRDPQQMGKLTRHAGAGLAWLSRFEEKDEKELPRAWKGEGANPIVIFRGGEDDPRQYFFGGKGGRGTVNHGNMDAGSFVFELDGVRWVADPGNQSYHALEKTGFDLWGSCQECERWTLLTKNNYGHSTLTVNNALHEVDGFASLTDFNEAEQPAATFDMSEVFEGQLASARRTFVKEDNRSILIEDQLELSDATELVTWQLMTTAEVIPSQEGAVLKQEGKELNLEILSPADVKVSVVSLDPPPLKLDRQIDNLKRI